ncbi:MOT1 [Blepharisma stoltei]|uniref:Uncharacterized protein n=1 Tax=Blepharisma stoltei TaxID=1481888 RepID=A0AAU9JT19_9CILI|nr:unnamed protein product [Blepharisma stoltei]
MEGRVKKLIDCITSNKSFELSQIASFQLGELSKDDSDLVCEEVSNLFYHVNWDVRIAAGLALSQILQKIQCLCITSASSFKLENLNLSYEEPDPSKKRNLELNGFQKLLEKSREKMLIGSWDEKHGACIAMKELVNSHFLCKECLEDAICRCLVIIGKDQVADYAEDLPEYPLRDLASDIISISKSAVREEALENFLSQLIEVTEPQGPLICLRKSKIYTQKAYKNIKNCLAQSEDIVLEACHYLTKYPLDQDQELVDILCNIIIESDDLSASLKYAIQVVDKLLNLGCRISCDMEKLYHLFFHKLQAVRYSTYSAFLGIIKTQQIDHESLFRIITQGIILENNKQIIQKCFELADSISQQYGISQFIIKFWNNWVNFLKNRRFEDYSFMLIYGQPGESPKEVYSFVDSESTDDINTIPYLEAKQFRGIWNICKAIKYVRRNENFTLGRVGANFTSIENIFHVLSSENANDYNDLLNVITTFPESSDGKLGFLRLRVLSCYRVAKLAIKEKIPLPDKITPILQVIVTGFTNESVPFLRYKIAKTAARITLAAIGRTCNEKFVQNLMKIDSLPLIKELQIIHKEAIVNRFQFYKALVEQPILNSLQNLKILTVYIHQSLFPLFIQLFSQILQAVDIEETNVIIVNIAIQIEECLIMFITHFLRDAEDNQLKENLLLVLQELLSPKYSHKLIPYSACFVLPLLKNLNSSLGHAITRIFGEILNLVLLDSPINEICEGLQRYREEGLHFLGQLKGSYELPTYEQRVKVNGISLREYQKEGIAWLRFLNIFGLCGMLCDEMGLGKTIQTLCAVAEAHLDYQDAISLVVCPTSVTGHWKEEVHRYFDKNILDADEFENNKKFSQGLLVISYNSLKKHIETLKEIEFLYIILDEGHLISNPNTQTYKAILQLKGKHRLILTGTPLQNKILELWPFFNFLMPGFLGTSAEFSNNYEKYLKPKKSEKQIQFRDEHAALKKLNLLHKKVLPFILRRLKKDVLQDLPEKIIQDYYVNLTTLQAFLLSKIKDEKSMKNDPLKEIIDIRKICNHPILKDSSANPSYKESPKLTALKELLIDCEIPEESGSGHKALIFSQMKKMLDLVENELLAKEFPLTAYKRLDGKTPLQKRADIVNEFNQNPKFRLMLLTTETGGLGLNLQSADVVIFIDHDWNPVKDLQAMDRAHRIGQKNVVNVYRLITKNTIEEEILGLQAFKSKIAETLVNVDNASMQAIDTISLLGNLSEAK